MTESVSPGLDKIVSEFKDAAWKAITEEAMRQLVKSVPWLGWPGVNIFVGVIGGLVAAKIFEALKLSMDLTAIQIKNEAHRREWNLEVTRLMVVAQAHGLDSPEYKEANEKAKHAFARFVGFTGN